MNTLLEQPKTGPSVVNSMAVTRALAKARLGDQEALRWLVEQRSAGSAVAARALDDYRRTQFKAA